MSNLFFKLFIKIGKRYLKKWAKEKLIPELQKEINAGAIDVAVDEKIKKVTLEMINKI